MFNLITRDKSFEWTVERCKQENNALFHQDPEKGSFDFNLDDVQHYCDWESVYIKHRSPQKNFFHQYVIDPQLRTML